MASQTVSPHEAEIARAKLLAGGAGEREPPKRPPAAPAPGSWSDWTMTYGTGTSSGTTNTAFGSFSGFGTIHIRIRY